MECYIFTRAAHVRDAKSCLSLCLDFLTVYIEHKSEILELHVETMSSSNEKASLAENVVVVCESPGSITHPGALLPLYPTLTAYNIDIELQGKLSSDDCRWLPMPCK